MALMTLVLTSALSFNLTSWMQRWHSGVMAYSIKTLDFLAEILRLSFLHLALTRLSASWALLILLPEP
ncbi:hypothetical protein E2C01_097842 [Portunus trituberculatus]|uniref:Uncharacterized protein n=1 Tax=Portunus trituberculatus TaxID=210409 RepID=A0A5B7KB48_PORTR|nr:hypothetical protein [Portunus trituberculatus]